MAKNDTPVLEDFLANNPDPSDLQISINSAVQSQSKDQIALIAQHIRQRLSPPIPITNLIEAIDNPTQDLPDNLQTILMSKEFLGLRKILNKLISSNYAQTLLLPDFINTSKELLGIFETLEEKHCFILTKPKLDALESFFNTQHTTINADRIGAIRINRKILNLLDNNPDELTPDFLRACVAFVAASKSSGKPRTIDKLDTLDQQVISGITNLVNSRINGILETAAASEELSNGINTENKLKALLAGKKFVALEKILRGLIHLKPEASDDSPNTDAPLIGAINDASETLKSLNALRAKIQEETPPTRATLTLLSFLTPDPRTAS